MLQLGFELGFRWIWGWLFATSLTAALLRRAYWAYFAVAAALALPIILMGRNADLPSALNFYVSALLLGLPTVMVWPLLRRHADWRGEVTRRRAEIRAPLTLLLTVAVTLRAIQVALQCLKVRTDGLAAGRRMVDEMGRAVERLNLVNPFASFNAAESYLNLRGSGLLGLGVYGHWVLGLRLIWGLIVPAFIIAAMNRSSAPLAWAWLLTASTFVGEGAALYLNFALGWNL